MQSFEEICQFGYLSQSVPWLGHAILPAGAFEMALKALLNPPPLDRARLDTCRGRVSQ
jgi:hypothetical protein